PAVQSLQRRLESGGALCCSDVSQSAQPFISALLRRSCPGRPIVVVTADLKAQESIQQDLETWLQVAAGRQEASARLTPGSKTPSLVAAEVTRRAFAQGNVGQSEPPCVGSYFLNGLPSSKVASGKPLFYPAWETL